MTATQIDLTSEIADPCTLIPQTVRDQNGIAGAGTVDPDGVLGPNCDYTRRSPTDPVVASGVNTKSGGLEGLYQRKSNFVTFEPTTIGGYPALTLNPQPDTTQCTVTVALNDDQLFYIDLRVGDPAPADPAAACAVTTQIATAVVSSLSK